MHEAIHRADEVTAFVTYHGDFEGAYRRSDGDEFGYLVPVEPIQRREAAAKALDEANEAIRSYIQQNDVAEVELSEFDEENQ
jgi:hypothetical protein